MGVMLRNYPSWHFPRYWESLYSTQTLLCPTFNKLESEQGATLPQEIVFTLPYTQSAFNVVLLQDRVPLKARKPVYTAIWHRNVRLSLSLSYLPSVFYHFLISKEYLGRSPGRMAGTVTGMQTRGSGGHLSDQLADITSFTDGHLIQSLLWHHMSYILQISSTRN